MAKNYSALPVSLTGKQQRLGFLYMAFSVLLLPRLLKLLFYILPVSADSLVINLVYFFVNFAAVIVIFAPFFKNSLRQLWAQPIRFIASIAGGYFAYSMLNVLLSFGIRSLFPDYVNLNDQNIGNMAQSQYVLMLLSSVVLAPVAEEMLYRGLLFGSLHAKSRVAAYLFSAAVFSLLHITSYIGLYTPVHMLVAFLQYLPAAFTLAAVYRISGCIYAPIAVHAAINLVGMLSMR